MKIPTYADLRSLRREGIRHASFAVGMHPNPRWYKYKWRIFWKGSPVEGIAFLKTDSLSTGAAFALMRSLEMSNEPFIVYNNRYPRLGNAKLDMDSPRWKGVEFAPAYDDDNDPAIEFGHR